MMDEKKVRGVQYFSDEYLDYCKTMTTEQIVKFLEDFMALQAAEVIPEGRHEDESVLISMRVPARLLNVFKHESRKRNIPYQRQIKALMLRWLQESS